MNAIPIIKPTDPNSATISKNRLCGYQCQSRQINKELKPPAPNPTKKIVTDENHACTDIDQNSNLVAMVLILFTPCWVKIIDPWEISKNRWVKLSGNDSNSVTTIPRASTP